MISSVGWIVVALFFGSVQVDFDTDIVPILTKSGCNSGACHGAAAGRGGFHLSLLGGDPAADHDAIVNALEGRRINLTKPELSILLQKPTGQLDHGGDTVLDSDDDGAAKLMAWISAGAPAGGKRKLTGFQVLPKRMLVEAAGDTVTVKAMAEFNHGPPEDVTRWTVFTVGDSSSIDLDPKTYVARVNRPGQHVVVARFLDRVVPIQLLLPLGSQVVDLSHEPKRNFVDEEVQQTLSVLRLPVSPLVNDAGFLRRVTLDLTGRLPTRKEVEDFLADKDSSKREKLVETLLNSDAFVDCWTHRLANLLRVRPLPNESEIAGVYHGWLREQVRKGAGLDDVALALLTAEGDSHEVGPANFARTTADARGQAELVSQVFMGVRLQCANCHNHPLDRWTQDDYHGLAAVFARLDRGRIVKLGPRGAVTNLRTGEPAIPRIPGTRYLEEAVDGRREVANWLIAKDNPYFAKAMVNRFWKAMFGRGLIEPTDDMRETNLATHPELLSRLADDFIASGFELRHTLRLLANSATYGRSGVTCPENEADDRFYSHAYRRPLEPEVLADALADVTGVYDQYGDLPLGTRAISLVDPLTPSISLDVLGRCTRQASCEAVESSVGLPTKLHQLNGALINRKITDPKGRLHAMLDTGQNSETVLTELYLTALGRRPSETELQFWRQQIGKSEQAEVAACFEDILWSLLSCSEFAMNH